MLLYVDSSNAGTCSIISNFSDSLITEVQNYLVNHPDSTFYHHPLWIKVLSIESEQNYYYIIHRNKDNGINGLLPLMTTKGLPFGILGVLGAKRLSSLPRTPLCGPLADTDFVKANLLNEAKKLSTSLETILQIKSACPIEDKNNIGIKSHEWRKSFLKEIPSENHDILFRDHKTERDILRNIKRAKENNIEFYEAQSIHDIHDWYEIYLEKMRFHGVPARPFVFFEACWNILKPAGLLDINLAIQKNGDSYKIFAGNFNYKFKKTCYGGFKAGNMKNAKIMYGDFLMNQEFINLQKNEYNFYDLGEVPRCSKTLERYKRKWGVSEIQLYHSYLNSENEISSEPLEFDKPESIRKRIWKHVPLSVTEKFGTIVTKFI